MFMRSAEIHHHEKESRAKDINDGAILVRRKLYRVVRRYDSLLEKWREGAPAVGRLIETTGVLETAARRQCVG